MVPESPRFLVTKGRNAEAMKIFKKIAKWNNKESSLENLKISLPDNKEIKNEV